MAWAHPLAPGSRYHLRNVEAGPLVWGGRQACRFGLDGPVMFDDYSAVFGAGGARDPDTGALLVSSRRPGTELIVNVPKSVSVLMALGLAKDAYAILAATVAAELGYLERWAMVEGGRSGRAAIRMPTHGLLWASVTHNASRSGEPHLHQHVLLANLVEWTAGGFRAMDNKQLYRHLAEAAAEGRAAGARQAIGLGYRLVPMPDRHGEILPSPLWRVAGVPLEVVRLFSSRSVEIEAEASKLTYEKDTYRKRDRLALSTRQAKSRTPVTEAGLVNRWRAEMAEAGWHPDRVLAMVEAGRVQSMIRGHDGGGLPDLWALASAVVEPGGTSGLRPVWKSDRQRRHVRYMVENPARALAVVAARTVARTVQMEQSLTVMD